MADEMRYNDRTGQYESAERERIPFKEKIKGKLAAYSQAREEEKEFKSDVKRQGKLAERNAYRQGYIAGKAKKAHRKGKEDAQRSFGGGIAGRLEGAARLASRHIEVRGASAEDFSLGSRVGHEDFGFSNGPSQIGAGIEGLMRGTSKGKKKRDPYAELGL